MNLPSYSEKGEKGLRTCYIVVSFLPTVLGLFLSEVLVRGLVAFCCPLIVFCGISGAIESTTILKPYYRLIWICVLGAVLGILVAIFRPLAYLFVFGGMIVYVLTQHRGRLMSFCRSMLDPIKEEIRCENQGCKIKPKEDRTMSDEDKRSTSFKLVLEGKSEDTILAGLEPLQRKCIVESIATILDGKRVPQEKNRSYWIISKKLLSENLSVDSDGRVWWKHRIKLVDVAEYGYDREVRPQLLYGQWLLAQVSEEIKRILATAEYIKGQQEEC